MKRVKLLVWRLKMLWWRLTGGALLRAADLALRASCALRRPAARRHERLFHAPDAMAGLKHGLYK